MVYSVDNLVDMWIQIEQDEVTLEYINYNESMPLSFTGTLKIVSKGRPFTDRETGEVTPAKYTNFFATQDNDGNPQVVEIKSKSDYTKYIDQLVDCSVQLYPMREGSGFWASLSDCRPAEIN